MSSWGKCDEKLRSNRQAQRKKKKGVQTLSQQEGGKKTASVGEAPGRLKFIPLGHTQASLKKKEVGRNLLPKRIHTSKNKDKKSENREG